MKVNRIQTENRIERIENEKNGTQIKIGIIFNSLIINSL